MRINVLNVCFDNLTIQQAVARAAEIIGCGEKSYVVTPNPEIVWSARHDSGLQAALNGAGLVLPDGIGVILAARILGTPLREKIPGIEFAAQCFEALAQSGGSVFLFGAKPGIAEQAGRKLAEAYPGLVVAGTANGYFKDDAPIIELINKSHPDMLLVCLGSPKQERWIAANLDRLDVHLCAGLGGSLDVFAGAVPRAPAFFRKLELEWLYRLFREPRRIKRMIKLPLFVFAVILKKLSGSKRMRRRG